MVLIMIKKIKKTSSAELDMLQIKK